MHEKNNTHKNKRNVGLKTSFEVEIDKTDDNDNDIYQDCNCLTCCGSCVLLLVTLAFLVSGALDEDVKDTMKIAGFILIVLTLALLSFRSFLGKLRNNRETGRHQTENLNLVENTDQTQEPERTTSCCLSFRFFRWKEDNPPSLKHLQNTDKTLTENKPENKRAKKTEKSPLLDQKQTTLDC